MSDKVVEKKDFAGKNVKVLAETYDPGVPAGRDKWREKLRDKKDMMMFLKTGQRYWYSSEWYGSEKRK